MSSLGMALALFLAGVVEYAIIGGWYDSFNQGRVGRVVLLTHVQLVLWLFVVGSVVAILQDPDAPRWFIAVYVEGCALSAGLTAWYAKRRRNASSRPVPVRHAPPPRRVAAVAGADPVLAKSISRWTARAGGGFERHERRLEDALFPLVPVRPAGQDGVPAAARPAARPVAEPKPMADGRGPALADPQL